MNIRSAISAPLPWLTLVAALLFSKRSKEKSKNKAPQPSKKPRRRLLPRTLKFTKDGIRFTVVLILIGIAAINTGNNLLYLIVAMMLSLIVISGVMSESTIKKLSVRRIMPRYFFKDAPTRIQLKVRNYKKIVPSYSFKIEETGTPEVTASPAYMIKLDAKKESPTNASYTFNRRGIHHLGELHIKTRFPFGLFIKGKHLTLPEELLVFPATTSTVNSRPALGTHGDSQNSIKKGQGTELYGLKNYTQGEDARLIHWKASSKVMGRNLGKTMNPAQGMSSGLLQKEFEEESSKRITLNFKNLSNKYKTDDAAYTHDDPLFEDKVDEAAILLKAYVDAGFAVGLKTLSVNMPPARNKAQLYKLLKVLALISPERTGAPIIVINGALKGSERPLK